MSLFDHASLTSLTAGNTLFSSQTAIRRRQISRLRDYLNGERFDQKRTRQRRHQLYKARLASHSTKRPDAVKRSLAENPNQYGLPRCWKILTAGEDVILDTKTHDVDRFVDENNTIYFAAFGVADRPIRVNSTWIDPKDITMSPDAAIYTIDTTNEHGDRFSLYLNFTHPTWHTGHLVVGNNNFVVTLQPWAVQFSVSVSANAGAAKSSGKQTLTWDETSDVWTKATWETDAMKFSYDTVAVVDIFGTKQMINEVSFVDSKDSTNLFQLTSNEWPTKYTSIMDGSIEKDAVYQYTIVNDPSDVPEPISIRAHDTVTSVYPVEALWKFDTFGTSFTGAYRLPNSAVVYAVKGTGLLPEVSAPNQGRPTALFSSTVKPLQSPFFVPGRDVVRDSSLNVTGLLNLNAMQTCDPSISPTGYVDVVSQKANEDFHDIICYHMDESIRKTFVSAGPINLDDPVVFQIANDDPGNKAFYQTLSVPYCTTSLAASALDEAKQCNGERAKKKLKDLPTQSEVYKRHSDALYRHRFNQLYSSLQLYMDDQANTDRAAEMAQAASTMKANLASQCADTNAHDPDGAQKLADAQADIDALCTWATTNKLFWAFELFYWGQMFYLPNLYAQTSNGTLSTSVSMHLKTLSTTMGMLEGGQQNPNGKSFQEAFNELIRLYQMSSIIPQFVDAQNNAEDIDSIQKAMLAQFAQEYADSPDQKLAAEAATAEQLAADDFTRGKFMTILVTCMRLSGTLGNWANIAKNFVAMLGRTSWYSKLANAAGLMSTLLRSTCVILLVLPIINSLGGGWGGMKREQKISWVTTCVGLGLTFALKAIAGVIRVTALWQDLGGLVQGFKVFMGTADAVPLVDQYAAECQNSLARWFVRDSEETMAITRTSVGLDRMTAGMRLFGRSAGEFITNCVGSVLAGVNLVLSAIDAEKSSDPLQKSLDSMLVLASSFQLLAIGATWLVSAAFVTAGGGVALCGMIASVSGPVAVVFAVIGLAIMMVMMFQNKTPPNPVQDFVNDQASKAGLTLSNGTAIDYLNIVPDDKANLSLLGIDFCAMDASNNQVGWLQLEAEMASSPGTYTVGHAAAVTFGPDTCWCVQTDAYGASNIFTYALNSEGNRGVVCLAELPDGSVGAVAPPSKLTKDSNGNVVPTDPSVYQAELDKQTWSFACQSAGGTTTRLIGGIPVTYQAAATFSITRGDKYLLFEKEKNVWIPKLGQPGFTWNLTLDSIGPSNFSYIQAPWNLIQTDRDERNPVMFSMPTSTPLNWSISPALPASLTIGSDGTITQTPNITPVVMADTTFTVTASVTLVGEKLSKSTTVTISIAENTLTTPSMLSNTLIDEEPGLCLGEIPPLPVSQPSAGHVDEAIGAGRDDVATPNVPAPPFFKWLQPAPMAYADHYTGQVAIALLKNSVTGEWGNDPGMIGEHGTFQALYFPHPPGNPGHNSNDPCDYGSAVSAFIAQAINNAGSQSCNWDLTQSKIDAFNNGLFNNNFDRFVDWLRSSGSTSVTGPHCSLDEYIASLRNPDWISLRASEQVDGTWKNQSLEMFQHCLKLSALGASDAQITQVMHTLTVRSSPSSPVLNPSGFPDITSDPVSWKSYRGYLVRSPISYTHLAIQGIGHTFWAEPASVPSGWGAPGHVQYTLQQDNEFLNATGNYAPQSSGGGSCFAGSTLVILGDGTTAKQIQNIQSGETVLSPTTQNPKTTKQVLYVSKPPRNSRSLFSSSKLPGILYTSTHPFLTGYSSDGSPSIAFVDPQLATSGNPLWSAHNLTALTRDSLVQYTSSTFDEKETLYDLVFAQDTTGGANYNVDTYVVENDQGVKMVVCSEVPSTQLLPQVTSFMLGFAASIGVHDDGKDFFPNGLIDEGLNLSLYIKNARESVYQSSQSASQDTVTSSPTMKDVHEVMATSTLDPQIVADTLEALIGALGLDLQIELDNGWRYIRPPRVGLASAIRPVLSFHFLQLRHDQVLTDTLQKALGQGEISASLSGSSLAPTSVSLSPLGGSRLFRLHGSSVFPPGFQLLKTTQSLTLSVGGSEFFATGDVSPDASARWAIYRPLGAGTPGTQVHLGFIYVSAADVPESVLPEMPGWEARVAKMGYAQSLGRAVGEGVRMAMVGK